MKFPFLFIALVLLFGISPVSAQDPDSLSFENDNDEYLVDLEEELMNMSLMQQESRARRSLIEIEEETEQVQHLKDMLEADIAILQDENKILSQKIERWISKSEALRRLISELHHENELLLSENDDLLDVTEASSEENDEVAIKHNMEIINQNEEDLARYEQDLKSLDDQISEAEASMETNEDTIEKSRDMIETCEWVITSNRKILEEFKP